MCAEECAEGKSCQCRLWDPADMAMWMWLARTFNSMRTKVTTDKCLQTSSAHLELIFFIVQFILSHSMLRDAACLVRNTFDCELAAEEKQGNLMTK